MSSRHAVFLSSALAALAAALAACSAPVVTVEVLPPRTSVTCAAPDVTDAALARGLLDASATETVHGGYVADLRLVSSGSDARVDGIDIRITREGKVLATFEDAPTGDIRLVGRDDDVRRGVLENVTLLPRAQARELARDGEVSKLEYATLLIELTPRLRDEGAVAETSSFALDVCDGCLVEPPAAPDCAGMVVPLPVCRVGQDVASFTCAAGMGGGA